MRPKMRLIRLRHLPVDTEVSRALTGQEGESDRSSRWLVTRSEKAKETVCHYDPRVMAAC